MRRKVTLLISLAAAATAGIITYYLYNELYLPSRATLPSPLSTVDFPTEEIPYSADWPDDLKFPREFALVDSSSGQLPDTGVTGWAMKLRYTGSPSLAKAFLISFLEGEGWTVAESTRVPENGFHLTIQRDDGNGIVVLAAQPQEPSQTLILAVVFP